MMNALAALLALTLLVPAKAGEKDFDGKGGAVATESLGDLIKAFKKGFKPVKKADDRYWVELPAKDKFERTRIASAGVSIEEIEGDKVRGMADGEALRILSESGITALKVMPLSQIGPEAFPPADKAFHTYDQLAAGLQAIAKNNPDIATVFSIGKTVQGREMWTLKLSAGASTKPAIYFMGSHHAREHLSTEVPFLLAQWLAEHKGDAKVKKLLAGREVYITPLVNPDGSEYDIETGDYRWQRKNMRDNGDGCSGVDLNRNYGHGWGGEGASDRTCSDTYRGPSAFSEPETQAVRDFVVSKPNMKVLLSFHTFSQLILWPWGGTYDPLPNAKDAAAFEKIGRTMAAWNGYTPEPSSALYLASGDTCDWAYGERGIFAFTFELDPGSGGDGGFYPGAKAIQPTFKKNLQPALYLIDLADDPLRVLKDVNPSTSAR